MKFSTQLEAEIEVAEMKLALAESSKTAATHERRNDDAAVESARERYLARKRQREGGS